MKVCMLAAEYPPVESGVALACRRIAQSQKAAEMHVLTFGTGGDSRFANRARCLDTRRENGVVVHRIAPYSGTLTNVPAQEVQNLCYFLEQLDSRHGFDIFQAFNITGCGLAAVLTAKKRKKKSLLSIRGNDMGRDAYDELRLGSLRFVLENADCVTSVSKDLLVLAAGIAQIRKSCVIPNSLDPFEFYFSDIKLRLDGFVVAFSGVVRRKKGFAYLLDAFRQLAARSTLLVIGELMAEEKGTYLNMIEGMGLADRVMITGKIPHRLVLNYLSLADVFVLPSVSEGCSNALLEAMYCRLPCIATRTGASPDIISHNRTGILIEPHSPAAILRALEGLRRSKKKRTQLGKNAKDAVQKKFTPDKEARAWLLAYRKCLR